MNEPSALGPEARSAVGVLRLVLGYLAIDFICTMLNRYVFKNEK